MTKYESSKQLESRPWLTILDAAKHLFKNGIGDGSEAYILSMALHRRLKLSVFFAKETSANPCYMVHYDMEDLKISVANNIYPEELKWCKTRDGIELASLNIDNGRFLNIHEKEWVSLVGPWDLPLIDGDALMVEQKWRKLTGNPETERKSLYGVFLEGDNGGFYRLKDFFNFSEYEKTYKERLKEQQRQNAINNLSKENSDLLLNLIKEDRESFLKARLRSRDFCLPKDSFFVVRTKELIEFERNEHMNFQENLQSASGANGSEILNDADGNQNDAEINSRELKQGLWEIWKKEKKPTMKSFFPTSLRKYVDIDKGLITQVITAGKDAGICYKTSYGTTGHIKKKTISNYLSGFKKM